MGLNVLLGAAADTANVGRPVSRADPADRVWGEGANLSCESRPMVHFLVIEKVNRHKGASSRQFWGRQTRVLNLGQCS